MKEHVVQPVFFESEEILSPRELKDKYYIGIHRTDTSNRPYSLEEIKKMLEDGTAHHVDPDKPSSPRGSARVITDPCKECPLRQDKKVYSCGDWKTAKVAFIGEAPGVDEVPAGTPFVGQAGQFLRAKLREVGIDENQAVFANVCRCRPPEKQPPPPEAIERCFPFLENEIREFKGLIVLLGSIAISAFLDKVNVSYVRGYGFERGGQHFFAMYHPSYILRNLGSEVAGYFDYDLKKVKTSLDFPKKVPYNMIQNEEDLRGFLEYIDSKPGSEVAFDIETTTLSPFDEGASILTTSFSWGTLDKKDNFCIPLSHPDSPWKDQLSIVVDALKKVFSNDKLKFIGHNGKFDLKWLKVCYGILPTSYWFDTMVAQYLYNGLGAPQELKTLAWKYTNFGGYGLDRSRLLDYTLEELCNYNVLDSLVCYQIKTVLRKRMLSEIPEQIPLLENILSKAVLVLVEMETEGLNLNAENLHELSKKYLEKIQALEVRMHSYSEIKSIEEKKHKMVNFGSPQQLSHIFKEMGFETKMKTKSGNENSTSYEALQEIKDKHPLVKDLLDYREASKVASTYLIPYGEILAKGPTVYAEYLLSRTATGRLACQKPNLQNIPYEVRPIFTAKRDWLLEVDFSQLEMRVMAMYSKDPNLIQVFQEGKDLHEETRMAIFGDNSSLSTLQRTKQRVEAKSVNFGIIYDVSEFGLAQQINVSEKYARQMIEAFFTKFLLVKKFMDSVKAFTLQHHYYQTFFGRRRYFRFENIVSGSMEHNRHLREAVNFPIQSTARDLVFDAEGRIWSEMHKRGLESTMIADVHDAAVFDVRDSELETLVEIIKNLAENFCHIPWVNVPLKIDLKLGTTWGKLEDL